MPCALQCAIIHRASVAQHVMAALIALLSGMLPNSCRSCNVLPGCRSDCSAKAELLRLQDVRR